MLVVESTERSCEIKLPSGIYTLNTELNDNVRICEYQGDVVKYEGVLNITPETDIKAYRYSLNEEGDKIMLPYFKFDNLWNNFIYDEKFKYFVFDHLLKSCALENEEFGDLLGINKSILLYGNPGTGKTTFSKALAQKLAIRTEKTIEFKEINCKSIFSKFYGESLHLISKLFKEAPENTIFLFDDVDSILLCRETLIMRNEPIDSVRIVNLFLNIMDQKKHIFIFTSNIKEELDPAFLDRCDIVVEMKMLNTEGIYNFLTATLNKMMEMRLLKFHSLLNFNDVLEFKELADPVSYFLFKLSHKILGISTRRIKKIIFDAFEKNIKLITLLERISFMSEAF